MAQFHRKDSFLKNTKVQDGLFLDVNKFPKIPSSVYDEDFQITQKYHQRPDLLAFQLYENSRLWWVFPLRNLDVLKDPIRDFRSGVTIKLPSAEVINKIVGV